MRIRLLLYFLAGALLHPIAYPVIAAELRVVGFNNNTLALLRVDEEAITIGDVYVVLDFEEKWFHEIGRFKVTKLLKSGVVGFVISSPKPPSEWYNKVAIPESAWDEDIALRIERDPLHQIISCATAGPNPKRNPGGRELDHDSVPVGRAGSDNRCAGSAEVDCRSVGSADNH